MPEDRTRGALQTIFSFFLGLMVVAFVAVGVNTFYESPEQRYSAEQQELSRQMERFNTKGSPDTMTSSDKAAYEALMTRQNALQDRIRAEMEIWGRNTSIILVLFATIVMSVSLIRSEQLRVISNGLLLGGLFTMLYGAGWVIFSGTSTARFYVILFAFVVTVALGYLKFVRGRTAPVMAARTGTAAAAAVLPEEIGDLEARVAALEARQAAAAAALGQSRAQ
ncbi:MAG: hypothetical protein Q7W30_05240 [Coriobacteriia bacterium]|nr:hypothetical protein [Coriobacteriia bacterium]